MSPHRTFVQDSPRGERMAATCFAGWRCPRTRRLLLGCRPSGSRRQCPTGRLPGLSCGTFHHQRRGGGPRHTRRLDPGLGKRRRHDLQADCYAGRHLERAAVLQECGEREHAGNRHDDGARACLLWRRLRGDDESRHRIGHERPERCLEPDRPAHSAGAVRAARYERAGAQPLPCDLVVSACLRRRQAAHGLQADRDRVRFDDVHRCGGGNGERHDHRAEERRDLSGRALGAERGRKLPGLDRLG